MQWRLILLLAYFTYAASLQNGDIRLAEGPTDIRGKLEIYEDGDWSSFCYDYGNHESQQGVAQFACRQLGLFNFVALGNVTSFGFNDTFPTMSRVGTTDCPSMPDPENAPQHVLRCSIGEMMCEAGDEMAIECSEQTRDSFPFDTMVEFYNEDGPAMGESTSEGYVQVYIAREDEFGPVCNMGQNDADTFCRQLSYTNAVSVDLRNATFINKEVVDTFKCSDSDRACLRDCFDYPSPNQEIDCPNGYSYVVCTFTPDPDKELLYGSKSSCSGAASGSDESSTNVGAIAGGVVGGVLGLVIIVVVVVVACYFVPGCYFNRKKRGEYSPVKKPNTKYDAI